MNSCSGCGGLGTQECVECDGSGEFEGDCDFCPECNGDGETDCEECWGTGETVEVIEEDGDE